MPSLHYRGKSRASEPLCCSPSAAWQWVSAIAEMAVHGDDDARRWLPEALDHALTAERVTR